MSHINKEKISSSKEDKILLSKEKRIKSIMIFLNNNRF